MVAGWRTPKPHQARKPLSARDRFDANPGELRCRVRIKGLLAQLIAPVHVARTRHAATEFRAGLRGIEHLTVVAHGLVGGHRAIPRCAGFEPEAQHFAGHLQLDRFEPPPFHLDGERHGEQLDDGKGERGFVLEVDAVVGARAGGGEPGIAQPAGLHQIGFGDAQAGIRCLQAAIVEQRDLHGVVGGQRLCEQCVGLALHVAPLMVGCRQRGAFAEAFFRHCLGWAETAVLRKRHATCRQQSG